VKIVPTAAFRRHYKKLTPAEQEAVSRALRRFQANPFDPALRTHKLSGHLAGDWAFSAGYDLRVVCGIEGDTAYLWAVGSHDDVY
jgi:mRNA-degrading endonuclease YafQ of YafQ-DinJ toxin-antitoxin module